MSRHDDAGYALLKNTDARKPKQSVSHMVENVFYCCTKNCKLVIRETRQHYRLQLQLVCTEDDDRNHPQLKANEDHKRATGV